MTARSHAPAEVDDRIATLWFKAPVSIPFERQSEANYYRHQLYYARKQMQAAHPQLKDLGVFVIPNGDRWNLEIRPKNSALLKALEEAGIPADTAPPLDEDMIP